MNCSDKTRRTMGEALGPANLSAEALAFLKPNLAKPLSKPSPPVNPPLDGLSTGSAPLPAAAPELQPIPEVAETKPADGPGGPGLVSMTFRVPAAIAFALLRASADRKMRRQTPFTQQEIIAEATRQWLRENGFLA